MINVGQFCINVADLDHSVHFYSEVLGLPVEHRIEIPGTIEAVLVGGKSGGRSMEPHPTSRRKLGKEAAKQRFPNYLTGFMKYSVTVKESREMMDMNLKGNFSMVTR